MDPAYSVIYSFKGRRDGAVPEAGLLNVKGTLYGTTYGGGASDNGTVFDLSTSGEERVLYRFSPFGSSGTDGANPQAALINVNGTLYGTTYGGGANGGKDANRGSVRGNGTVFDVSTAGSERVVYRFKRHPDGSGPTAGLINVKGTLYGTTQYGGTGGQGTVFAITTSGVETVLHSFAGGSRDGADPWAGLINVNGTLYGTTQLGGACTSSDFGCGTVFKTTTSGTETVLYSFKGGSSDGKYPIAGLINVNGTLYGTTGGGGANGYGTVFKITTSGKETALHSFAGGSGDGAGPEAGLINVKGTLYGTTEYGGGSGCASVDGCGIVFKMRPSGKETVLYRFKGGTDGAVPYAGLLNVQGTLYGTTSGGGANCGSGSGGCGTVFSLSP